MICITSCLKCFVEVLVKLYDKKVFVNVTVFFENVIGCSVYALNLQLQK